MANSRPRIFYLDFIRAIATVSIILTHFNALYLYNAAPQRPEMAVVALYVSNIYIGDFGVSLFFIISGASLMYVYDERFDAKIFYKKRLLNIYPMFWLAYLFAALYRYYTWHSFVDGGPRWHILFSILGIDSYLGNYGISAYTLVGEWFIGVILMMYAVFPLLRLGVQKKPVVTAVLALILGLLSTFFWGRTIGLLARIPEFLFGMLFVKYWKKVSWKVGLPALGILIVNGIVKPVLPENIETFYVGVLTFVFLVWLVDVLTWAPLRSVCKTIGKYSYPCFLVHHFIILQMAGHFDLNTISLAGSYALCAACTLVIAFFSWALQKVYDTLKTIVHAKYTWAD